MNSFIRFELAVIVILAFVPLVHAQGPHAPSLEEILQLKVLSDSRISPDGRFVAYRVRETDWNEDSYIQQIWLVDAATGISSQLTRGKRSTGTAEWSPDGRWLAFVSERELNTISPAIPVYSKEWKDEKQGKGEDVHAVDEKVASRQIWLISPTGGEAWQLTRHETDISTFHWSKDGKQIAFVAPVGEGAAEERRKSKYGNYDVIEKDFRQNALWTVAMADAETRFTAVKAERITREATINVKGFSWSPDSKHIVFSATRNPLRAFKGDEDIYLVDLSHDNDTRKIVALDGPDGHPIFSPDGKQIAFYTALAQPNFYYANAHIGVVDVDHVLAEAAVSRGSVRDLTRNFDENPQLVDWGPDGIYFVGLQKTYTHLFRVDTKTGQISSITPADIPKLDSVSFTTDFKTVAIVAEDSTHMPEIFISPVSDFSPRRLTDMTEQVKDLTMGSSEVVSWKSIDGTTIEGILRKPPGFDPSKKYPLLVQLHGGPDNVSRATLLADDGDYYPYQSFLAKGTLVLLPNYRGSAGYGATFRSLNVRNLGIGDMWDVMSGVDYLIARGLADPARLGCMGWSEGGYIAAFLTTHTDRFKAISVGAGISDWITYYVGTDDTPFTRQYLLSNPWDDPAIYAKTSPIATIKQAKTPTLIQQGSVDKRVPVLDSFELYRGLQDQHVPSRLILYTGFGHDITRPKSNRAVMESNLDWFAHYIWGEEFPEGTPLRGSNELAPTE